MSRSSAALVAFVLSLVSGTALATPPVADGTHFSSRGRRMVSGHVTGGYTDITQAGATPGPSWWLSLSPGLTYFVRESLGLGVYTNISVAQTTRGDSKNLSVATGVQALYDWRLTDRLSLLFVPYAAFRWQRYELEDSSSSVRGLELGMTAPLTFHASSAVALGIGPFVSALRIFDGDNRATYGTFVQATGGRAVGLTSFIGYSF